MCRVTRGLLRVAVGDLRVTVGYLRVTIGHPRQGSLYVGHLRVTKANTTELHPKVRQTCTLPMSEMVMFAGLCSILTYVNSSGIANLWISS